MNSPNPYQKTLNLPTTSFPMKANLSQKEPECLKFWEEHKIYEKIQKKHQHHPKFILHDGPPYANGALHIGHAVNKILKDIILKSKSLSGYSNLYVPGWDCHGLPIELNVEKKVGKAHKDISAIEFAKACRAYATQQWQHQRSEFIRLGVFADWNHPYLTMDKAFEAEIMRTFAEIYAKGFVQQGLKPVHWCMDCGSSLSEAEVEYENKTSLAIDVRFAVKDIDSFLEKIHLKNSEQKDQILNISIPIWTTTPWTLPANQAVALHPSYNYVLVQVETLEGTECLVIAEELLKSCLERYGIEHHEILGHAKGEELKEVLLQHPFYDRQVPIVWGEHVTLETGTGAVHTAPAHGLEDYLAGTQYGLSFENYLNPHGVFLNHTPLFAGLHIYAANEHIVELLKQQHQLLLTVSLEHSYPHCWRHKKPLIFMSTPQWFISMNAHQLREKALEAIANVEWFPEWGEQRISKMISSRPDWCISRQRTWGTPLAIFIHKETRHPHPLTEKLILKIAENVEQHGIEIYLALLASLKNESSEIPLKNEIELLKKSLIDIAGVNLFEEYSPISDILDVWFDAGSSYKSVLQKNPQLSFPANLYLEGSDQHRGWFHTSLLSSIAHSGVAPYLQVLTHGFTVDKHGRKMSKSLGNVITPQQVLKTSGADILRLWVAASDYRSEISFSDQLLQRITDAYRRIRNTIRFLLANLADFDAKQDTVATEQLLSLDRYILLNAFSLQKELIHHYEMYEFHPIFQKIHHFCSQHLGSFYLDVIKDRQYTLPQKSLARRSAQTAIYHILNALCRWIVPILSFTAEEIWQHLPNKTEESVFLSEWSYPFGKTLEELNKNLKDEVDWSLVLNVRDVIHKKIEILRNKGKIGSTLEAHVILFCDPALFKTFEYFKDELKFIFMTSNATLTSLDEAPHHAQKDDMDGLAIVIEILNFEKCERCWHRTQDVGIHIHHPTLCERCIGNIEGKEELRLFA